jgi:hypothetical protein
LIRPENENTTQIAEKAWIEANNMLVVSGI